MSAPPDGSDDAGNLVTLLPEIDAARSRIEALL
jgi:hypothetical protein